MTDENDDHMVEVTWKKILLWGGVGFLLVVLFLVGSDSGSEASSPSSPPPDYSRMVREALHDIGLAYDRVDVTPGGYVVDLYLTRASTVAWEMSGCDSQRQYLNVLAGKILRKYGPDADHVSIDVHSYTGREIGSRGVWGHHC